MCFHAFKLWSHAETFDKQLSQHLEWEVSEHYVQTNISEPPFLFMKPCGNKFHWGGGVIFARELEPIMIINAA